MRRWREGSGGGESMDERLWGRLQDHIDLEAEVLPIGDFFRLRLVCKEWNRLASDRAFLKQTIIPLLIPSAYFIMGGRKSTHDCTCESSVMGSWLLYYESWARRWSWTRLPPWDFQVSGLLYDGIEGKAFNIHTRIFHVLALNSNPSPEEARYEYQVVDRDDDIWRTQIDSVKSGCWSGRSLTRFSNKTSCATSDTIVYVRAWTKSLGDPIFHTYNRVDNNLGSPSLGTEMAESMVIFNIGAWQGRLFLFGMKKLEHGRFTITAWQLRSRIPVSAADWTLFGQMPDDVCAWTVVDEIKDKFGDNDVIQMQTQFTREHVLLFVTVGNFLYVMEQAVLYNLELKTWEKVQLPGPRCHDLSLQQALEDAREFSNQDCLDVQDQN